MFAYVGRIQNLKYLTDRGLDAALRPLNLVCQLASINLLEEWDHFLRGVERPSLELVMEFDVRSTVKLSLARLRATVVPGCPRVT